MKKYLIDTNVIIELLRGNRNIASCIANAGVSNCAISIITDYELTYGAFHAQPEYREREIEKVRSIRERFSVIGLPDSEKWAEAKQRLQSSGLGIDDFDLIIAETAKEGGYIAVTDNVKHLGRLDGLLLENWIDRKDQ
ncbi:MAG: PIN domain-containing protein [Bacteroidaceae bacterium]|nr:PIN domain-containing protein [Bacteroidaceae bacterium]